MIDRGLAMVSKIDGSIYDILNVRLFGFGIPYRVEINDVNGVVPLQTNPDLEAADLARALALLAGKKVDPMSTTEDTWAVSVPFGRCGLDGRPREHLMVYGAQEAYLDVLALDDVSEITMAPDQLVAIEPKTVVRLRARPLVGQRVLVAFQTQDRTPLLGNAAPFTLDGTVPEDYAGRLRKAHAAFTEVQTLWRDDQKAYRGALESFFGFMAKRLAGNQEVEACSAEARRVGSYDVGDELVLFESQQAMLDHSLLERIREKDSDLFRFPGMFGAITTLFNYLK
jgi:hypothetical protein